MQLINVTQTDSGMKVDGRELHEFLEVGRDFTNWIKDRIEKYGFVEDYDYKLTLTKIGERQNVTRHDYELSIEMAKELCMVENNDKGKQARKYFIDCEKRYKSNSFDVGRLSPEMQMFKHMFDAVAKTQIEAAEQSRKLVLVENNLNTIKDTIIQREDDWRDSLKKMFNNAVKNSNGHDYQSMRNESYRILEERAHCDLARRQRNMQDRLKESGATKTKISSISKIDVIEDDPRLKEIYTSIVKEMSVRSMRMNA